MATVLIEDAGGVRTLTLNRPERRNALTPEMQLELIAAMEAVAKDNSVRVVVLTGAGEGFCGGLDLSVLQGMAGLSAAEYEADARRIARMFRVLYELSVPTIAAVNGHAVAGERGWLRYVTSRWRCRGRSSGIRRCGLGLCRLWFRLT